MLDALLSPIRLWLLNLLDGMTTPCRRCRAGGKVSHPHVNGHA